MAAKQGNTDASLRHNAVNPGVAMNLRPARRRAWMLCGFVLLGFLFAAVIGEVALRLGGYSPSYVNPLNGFHEAHALLGYRGKPNFTARFRRPDFDVVIAHDENGFRKQQYQNQRTAVRHTIHVFGDSFTWGWGVGQGKVLTDQMSLMLPDYRVLNFGLNGSGTVQQFTLFEAYDRERIQPGDTLVLMFNGNDFVDNLKGYLRAEVSGGRVHRIGPVRQLGSWGGRQFRDASYLYNFVVFSAQVLSATLTERRAEKWAGKMPRLDESSAEIIVAKHFLAEFHSALARRLAQFVVAYIPQQGELDEALERSAEGAKNERALRQAFFACTESLGIRTLDLLPYFREAKRSGSHGRLTFPHDRHWNENGHAVAAKVVSDSIVVAARQ